jgi:hypothetical protein
VVYVADYGNNAVRKVLYEEWQYPLGSVTTLVGRSLWGARPAGLVLSFRYNRPVSLFQCTRLFI